MKEINIKIVQDESNMRKVLAIETSCDETSRGLGDVYKRQPLFRRAPHGSRGGPIIK